MVTKTFFFSSNDDRLCSACGKKIWADDIWKYFTYFLLKIGFDISCILSIFWGKIFENVVCWIRGGWMWRRCRVCYVTGVSNCYWLIVGQVAGKGRGGCFYFFCFFTFILVLFLPCPSLSSLLSLFSLSLGDDIKWPTRVDMSLNPNTINHVCWICPESGKG